MKRRPFAALLVVNWRLKIAAKSLPNLLKWEGTVSQGITDTSTMVGLALLITLPLSGLAGTAQAQQVQQSPVAAVPTEESNYPSGTRLRSTYEEIGGAVKLAVPRIGMTPAAAALGGAAEIQNRLPAGFTLGRGSTVQVSGTLPSREAAGAERRFGVVEEAQPQAIPTKYVTLYPVDYNGIPLSKGSDYLAIVAEDGRLLHTRERSLPTEVDTTTASVTPEAAIDAAKSAAGVEFAGGQLVVDDPKLEIFVSPNLAGRLAWTVRLESADMAQPAARRYWVSASGEPEVLNWESEIYHTHFGTVSGNLWTESPLGSTANMGLRHLEVRRSGAGGGGMATTALDGRYGFTSGMGVADLKATLAGDFSVVQNMGGPVMTEAKSNDHKTASDLNFGASNEPTLAQVTAYHWTNVAHDMAQDILDPASDAVNLEKLTTRVNINSSCNAFWNGNSINFFKSGGSCPNTAYSDVVLHEYGHGVDHAKGNILDGGYSEGFGDAMALLGTRQSCLGRDFFGSGTCLRPATDVILWPPAGGEGVHAIGRRYAGFTWELINQLKTVYSDDGTYGIAGRLILAAAQANPSDIPDAVHLSFLMDDDDGNLANGTPHFKQLANAADSRNIPRPADPPVQQGVVTAAAHFPWSQFKKVSANSNIAEATITLTAPTNVHISANSSARTTGTSVRVRTGFYTGSSTGVMWTNSLRDVSLPSATEWENFGSEMAINLPAGTHTIYWKLWTNREIEFSSGTLLVEGLGAGGPLMALAAAPITEASEVEQAQAEGGREPVAVTSVDESGDAVTSLAQ